MPSVVMSALTLAGVDRRQLVVESIANIWWSEELCPYTWSAGWARKRGQSQCVAAWG